MLSIFRRGSKGSNNGADGDAGDPGMTKVHDVVSETIPERPS